MRNDNGELNGFGFVCFKDPKSTLEAEQQLHGKDGLHVVRALKK